MVHLQAPMALCGGIDVVGGLVGTGMKSAVPGSNGDAQPQLQCSRSTGVAPAELDLVKGTQTSLMAEKGRVSGLEDDDDGVRRASVDDRSCTVAVDC